MVIPVQGLDRKVSMILDVTEKYTNIYINEGNVWKNNQLISAEESQFNYTNNI